MEDKIVLKIEKCLKLSESSNPHEAETALRQAKFLMNKYNILQTDVDFGTSESSTNIAFTGAKKNIEWIYGLVEAVSKFCGVYGSIQITSNRRYIDEKLAGKIRLSVLWKGKESSCKIADYYFVRLQRDLMKRKAQYIQSLKDEHLSFGESFKKSFIIDAGNTYLLGTTATVSKRLLEMIDDNDSENFAKRKEHFRSKDSKGVTLNANKIKKPNLYGFAYSQGNKDGESVSLSMGVDGRTQKHLM